jgi:glycosyltransferase involved in cell wall biosynthesis
MKKVLFISYMFPPIAGGGIQRPLKFVKYLPSCGITPVVFCPEKALWRVNIHEKEEYDFLNKTTIYRCGIKRLERYFNLRFKKGITQHPHFYMLALKYLWYMDFQSAWYFECRRKALQIAREENVDCVFTTSPPHSTHLFGVFLKKNAGIPWIMDIRDAMYDDPNVERTIGVRIKSAIKYLYEKKFYSSADAIISVSDPIIDSIRRRHKRLNLESKTHTITNGFDREDFENIQLDNRSGKFLIITYTGSFMGKQTPEHFLEAINLLIEKKAIDASDLLIRFIGYFDQRTHTIFQRFMPKIPMEIIDFQPYEKSLWYQVNSDLLLLIVSIEGREGGSQTMTGKFFEYIGAKRPIFAVVPDGPLKKTIKKGCFGIVVPPKDINEIAGKFKILYDEWKRNGALNFEPDMNLRKSYTRERLTGKLSSIIDNLVS